MNNVLELAELGSRGATSEERIKRVITRVRTHNFVGGEPLFQSKVSPPKWMVKESRSDYVVPSAWKPQWRLMEAVYTVEQLRDDPTLEWQLVGDPPSTLRHKRHHLILAFFELLLTLK